MGLAPVGIGGLVGSQIGGTISNSYAAGTVDGDNYVGGLVGITDSDISNSSVTGNVSGIDNVGGLVGYSEGTITYSSYATVDVTGNDNVGGLVGYSLGTISNSYATGDVTGSGEYIGGLVGWLEAGATISNSYAKTGTVTGTGTDDWVFWEDGSSDEGDHGIGGLVGYSSGYISDSYAEGNVNGFKQVGGLVGSTGVATHITNSYATGNVGGTYDVGGLVGQLESGHTIADSYATGNVTGEYDIGGLVGDLYEFGSITNSYATGNVTGESDFGGLVGSSEGDIDNSYATGDVTSISAGCDCGDAGGLVGYSDGGTISNSYASGDVRGGDYDIGGLVGELDEFGSITNSYATGTVEGIDKVGGLVGELTGDITNSYATGNVDGTDEVGGLVGYSYSVGYIDNSYATGDVDGTNDVGGLIGSSEGGITGSYGYGEATINGTPIEEDPHLGEGDAPQILSIVNFGFADPNLPFAVSASINDGFPYLISLIESYDVAVTPSFSLRSYYTQAAKSLDKALTSFGFKSNFSSHPNLGFKALEQNQSNSPAVIQLFEVSEYQNSNILLNKDDGLQLSISSYYKESVEIWTQGLNGEYLYLGLIEFDKDGKAILPTLKFDTASTYQLLMIKAADKVNEKPNLEAKVGQITINVF